MAAAFPVVDISPALVSLHTPIDGNSEGAKLVAAQLYDACSSWGAFLCVGHGAPVDVQKNIHESGRRFFNLPLEEKLKLHVQNGGVAWRGYMPQGGERTHGKTDQKEGLYVGPEHEECDPRVIARTPLYGKNQFPDETVPELRSAVLKYIDDVTQLGNRLMELVSLSLGLDPQYINEHVTLGDPIALVRLFNYPPSTEKIVTGEGEKVEQWGIGAHTDYGLWTLLKQFAPGLQFEHPEKGWVDVPFDEAAMICNVGDVLDRMTGGRFKSMRHRAKNTQASDRMTVPFFYDPNWDAEMKPMPLDHLPACEDENKEKRWASTSIVKLEGKYSLFLAKKVSKIFADVIPEGVAESLQTTKAASTRFAIRIPINGNLKG